MRILIREVGQSEFFWKSKEMTKEELLNDLKVILKPSMFGNKNFDIIIKYN